MPVLAHHPRGPPVANNQQAIYDVVSGTAINTGGTGEGGGSG